MSAAPDPSDKEKGQSLWGQAWKRLKKNRLAMGSFAFVVLLALVGFLSPLWERVWTHFSPNEQHLLTNRPPGVRDVSIEHPTYDGDARAFDLVDFDRDGFLRCRFVSASPALPPGFRELERLSPALFAEAVADFEAADRAWSGELRRALSLVQGFVECPELQLADDVATGFFDKLLTDQYDVARGDEDPVPGRRGGDKFLSWKEYPKDDLDVPEHLRGLGLAGPDAFRRLDVDGDHVLAEWEIVERTRYLRYASVDLRRKSFDPFLRNFDADSDLAISRAEFPGAPELHTFVLGTDYAGRDVLTRLLYGARLSIAIGILATLVSLFIGVLYGATAGYVGGRTDNIMMRFVDVLYGLPFMFIVILLMVIIDDRNNVVLLFMALGAVQWLTMARVVRGQVLSLKNREFIEAARAIGVSRPAVVLRHLIPNAIGPVVVYATLLVPAVILEEAFLSFLGLGVEMSWGSMIAEGASVSKIQDFPWLIVFPALGLASTLFALNFLGDGVRDAMDPQLKGK